MPILISTIGRFSKKSSESELNALYINRASALMKSSGFGALDEHNIPESKLADVALRKNDEASRILKAHPDNAKLIALDENGKAMGSREFSILLTSLLEERFTPHFVIGGPDGHGEAVLSKAVHTLCFGKMTWPHKLARIMLSEQIYRALCLHQGHPYHRD